MKKAILILLIAALALPVFARDIDAVVDVAWLEANLSDPSLVVVDMRKVEDYKAGHIPGAVNIQGSSIYVPAGGLANELPYMDDLADILGAAGIAPASKVVVVESDSGRFIWATRVAWTFAYAGMDNVAVLSGGQAAWAKAGKPMATDVVKRAKAKFAAAPRPEYLATRDQVVASKGQIVDARAYDNYFGLAKQGIIAQFGHFPGAFALPAAWINNAEGLVKSKADLAAYPAALGLDPNAETIVYCDTGVLASAWWWIMKEYLGWPNVKNSDGSSQDLTKDPRVKYVTLTWK